MNAADAADAGRMAEGEAAHEVFVDGIALWTPAWPGWEQALPALREDAGATTGGADGGAGSDAGTGTSAGDGNASATRLARPAPIGLAANERRRAPDSVLIALAVAEQAVAMSGHDAKTLASVFASAHGDLPIVDALARTLAGDPTLLSPTRFHHSVHNAPSGYWSIASGSHAASTAVAAFDTSFGAGLLEALTQVACDDRPLLLVGADTEAVGPLASVNTSRGLLGVALVLAPRRGPGSRCALRWRLVADERSGRRAAASVLGRALAGNAQADALPLFEALARLAPGPFEPPGRTGVEASGRTPVQASGRALEASRRTGGVASAPAAALELTCGPGCKLAIELRPCAVPG